MQADVPTMLLMIIACSVIMAGALAVVGWGQRRDGMGCWAAGLLLHSVAYVLLSLRGRIPDLLSIVVANGLIAGAFAALLAAVHQFQSRPWPLWRMALPVAIVVLAFPFLLDQYAARVALGSTVYTVQIGLLLWALGSPGHIAPGRGAVLLMAGLALQAIVLLVRVGAALWGAEQPSGLLQSGTVQSLTFLTSFVTVLTASLGFVFMSKDRLDDGNRRMAAIDPLTGAANRRSIILALDRDVARAVRMREPLALMMVDIDHFKRVNDEYGHLAGDHVLCHVVDVLRDRVRTQDMVGRYGGEEFLVLLPDTGLKGAAELARQLCHSVEQSPCIWEGKPLFVTVSIGVFGARMEPGDSWDMLIDAADRAMYRAKQNGRNRVEAVADLRRLASRPSLRDNPDTFPSSML